MADAPMLPEGPARLGAWQALSELFLDTEIGEAEIAAIVLQLRRTGLGVPELERIYEHEVAPVCRRNLAAVPGGAWSGFQPEWLADAIAHAQQRLAWLDAWPWLKRVFVKQWTRSTREDWERVKTRLMAG